MVVSLRSVRKNGLQDWFIQRVSAVVLAVYILFLIGFMLTHSGMQFADWRELFSTTWMRLFSILCLLSLIAHAWIGLWTISTDYLKPVGIRLIFQVVVILALLAFLAWGIEILWGIGL